MVTGVAEAIRYKEASTLGQAGRKVEAPVVTTLVVDEPNPSFAEQLRALIDQRDWSNSEVARRAGLDRAYLQRLLSGTVRRPSPKTLRRLEEALEVERGFFRLPRPKAHTVENRLTQIEAGLDRLSEAQGAADELQAQSLVQLANLGEAVQELAKLVQRLVPPP